MLISLKMQAGRQAGRQAYASRPRQAHDYIHESIPYATKSRKR